MLVAPGNPDKSVLIHRVGTTRQGRMPPVASGVVDEKGLELLKQWVKSLR
jgi:hypothetical protein